MKKIILVKMAMHEDQLLSKPTRERLFSDLDDLEVEQAYPLSLSDISDMITVTLPIIPVVQSGRSLQQEAGSTGVESPLALLRRFATSSGIYGFAAAAVPLVSLVLTPFLAHRLTPTDYGVLAITNTVIGLVAGITQCGLSSAFFRAYNFDYCHEQDRDAVVITTTLLLCFISIPVTLIIMLLSAQLARFLFGNSGYALDISLAGGVVLLQNLTVPGLAWLRAENRPFFYSLLSISNLLGTLLATLLLVGALNGGVAGAIIANGLGYALIVLCTLPAIFFRKGVKLRFDMARDMLAFGSPLILNFVSYWILQLSDRYLLSSMTSLAQAARYTVAYTLGSVMAPLIIGPFTLAWPTAMFAIARRKDAPEIFRLVFRWFGLFLLFATFGLSLAGIFLLDRLFPATYYSAAPVIPMVTISLAFYGLYYIFAVGVNIKRKTWLVSLYTCIAALLNVLLNLILIPSYGLVGAALSTFLAYVVLALLAYSVNQKIYPIHFEIGRFGLALALGIGLYVGSGLLAHSVRAGKDLSLCIALLSLCFYGACLVPLLKLPIRGRNKVSLKNLEQDHS